MDYYLWNESTHAREFFYPSYYKSIAGPVFDATKKHAANLSNAFLVSLQNLSAYIRGKHPAQVNPGSISAVRAGIKDTLLKDGMYYSFKQLWLNRPVLHINPGKIIDPSLLENYLDAEDFAPLSTACAIVKDGILYVCVRKNVYHKAVPVFASGKIILLDVLNKKSSLKDLYYITNTGIVGAIVNELASQSEPRKGREFVIDMETGLIQK